MLLGIFIPPLGGVMLGDYFFIYKRRLPMLQYIKFKLFRVGPVLAYVVGAVVAFITDRMAFGIPPLFGIVLLGRVRAAVRLAAWQAGRQRPSRDRRRPRNRLTRGQYECEGRLTDEHWKPVRPEREDRHEALSVCCVQFAPVGAQTVRELDENTQTMLDYLDMAVSAFPGVGPRGVPGGVLPGLWRRSISMRR